jgi:glutathione S-transferase
MKLRWSIAQFSGLQVAVTIFPMTIDLWWGSGSPYSWRVMLALEHKGLDYRSHPLQLALQEHKAPQMLAMNPRGRLPVLKHDDYVVFESVAVLYYLDLKYPEPPIFGRSPEEAAVILRVIEEFQAYTEPHIMGICRTLLGTGPGPADERPLDADGLTDAMHVVAREARTIEQRVSRFDWIVGEDYSAIDMVIFPAIQLLRRALARPGAGDLAGRFLPIESNYPALGRWLARIEALPGYERTYPPHWRSG